MLDDLMLIHHCLWSELPHDLATLASLDGVLPKLKHLSVQDPTLYNWGDCVETLVCFEVYRKELALDPLSTKVYKNQMLPLVNIHSRASERGLPIQKGIVWDRMAKEVDKLSEAVKIAWAFVGYPINLGSPGEKGQVAVMLRVLGFKLPKDRKTHKESVDRDAIGTLRQRLGPAYDPEQEKRQGVTVEYVLARIEEGANPLLEARMLYAQALQVLSHYLMPLVIA
jgi:DNA polymerase I-like protein with 3'-5' exonuclease and polymerase domains